MFLMWSCSWWWQKHQKLWTQKRRGTKATATTTHILLLCLHLLVKGKHKKVLLKRGRGCKCCHHHQHRYLQKGIFMVPFILQASIKRFENVLLFPGIDKRSRIVSSGRCCNVCNRMMGSIRWVCGRWVSWPVIDGRSIWGVNVLTGCHGKDGNE